jgi:hypothetical protein
MAPLKYGFEDLRQSVVKSSEHIGGSLAGETLIDG